MMIFFLTRTQAWNKEIEKFIFIMVTRVTIFIIYCTLDDFDNADPSSMQDAYYIST